MGGPGGGFSGSSGHLEQDTVEANTDYCQQYGYNDHAVEVTHGEARANVVQIPGFLHPYPNPVPWQPVWERDGMAIQRDAAKGRPINYLVGCRGNDILETLDGVWEEGRILAVIHLAR